MGKMDDVMAANLHKCTAYLCGQSGLIGGGRVTSPVACRAQQQQQQQQGSTSGAPL